MDLFPLRLEALSRNLKYLAFLSKKWKKQEGERVAKSKEKKPAKNLWVKKHYFLRITVALKSLIFSPSGG